MRVSEEVIEMIFVFLPLRDLCTMFSVCKTWRRIGIPILEKHRIILEGNIIDLIGNRTLEGYPRQFLNPIATNQIVFSSSLLATGTGDMIGEMDNGFAICVQNLKSSRDLFIALDLGEKYTASVHSLVISTPGWYIGQTQARKEPWSLLGSCNSTSWFMLHTFHPSEFSVEESHTRVGFVCYKVPLPQATRGSFYRHFKLLRSLDNDLGWSEVFGYFGLIGQLSFIS